jgi:predicted RNA-binding protein with PIN domain
MRRRSMRSKPEKVADSVKTAHEAVFALGAQIMSAHQTTNELMRVQFAAVEKNFARVHETMSEVKKDLKEDAVSIKQDVEDNRKLSDERHLSMVKKVWWITGIIVAIEAMTQFFDLRFLARH